MTALVAFMETLLPANTLPVRDATVPSVPGQAAAEGEASDPAVAPAR